MAVPPTHPRMQAGHPNEAQRWGARLNRAGGALSDRHLRLPHVSKAGAYDATHNGSNLLWGLNGRILQIPHGDGCHPSQQRRNIGHGCGRLGYGVEGFEINTVSYKARFWRESCNDTAIDAIATFPSK
ncbi:hypothetical protein I7I51_05295 [Histoplasma capsulatum]|uniref:Uncharacterized protein n=1 Tax=Ajellomyces capsulatus TaxID=5037 RepID=A0A8A1M4E8_AJECA|nr:hypothetical protein I7I51_05295 [Histoplasma capsulatum]